MVVGNTVRGLRQISLVLLARNTPDVYETPQTFAYFFITFRLCCFFIGELTRREA